MASLYRVGTDYYVDTALLRAVAETAVVEPMAGGYQILSRTGLVRCIPVRQQLPGQDGELFCLRGDHVSALTRRVKPSAQWESWPPLSSGNVKSCGKACACGPCKTRHHDH